MYLKRIEIQGFKTFADKTSLELGTGITAVVGPNGTGKSNISDAILWALGEQNVRELRGTKSQDVIFAGTDKRKPIGMAEVSMTIDNTSGRLPLSFSEVTVTRRAYRSGDGEYFINKTPCRLKDIYELFMDTGVGREAYSMISQGEMDAVLSARSEDRRVLFEEAAGVKKYRHRRKEATKKLDNTQANLQRVYDIINELSDQIEPLREQAEVAKRYNELSKRLHEIEIGLLINELRRKSSDLDTIRSTKGDGGARIADLDSRIDDLDWKKEQLQENLVEMERQVDHSRAGFQELSTERQRLQSLAELMEEKTRAADEARTNLDAEISALETRQQETRERIARLELETEAAGDRDADLAAQIADLGKQADDLERQIEEASKLVDDQKANYIELAREVATKRSDAENRQARIEELKATRAKLDSELEALFHDKNESSKRSQEAAESLEALTQALSTLTQRLESLRADRAEHEKRVAEETKALDDLHKRILEKSSRLRALTEMAESHEGFFQGVRSVMTAVKQRRLKGSFAVVADIMTVPDGLETAIEVAMGSSVQDVVADSVDDAKRAIQFLKDNNGGRATFLPLDGIRPTMSSAMADLTDRPGFIGMASDLVDYERKFTPAINLLLGKVVVVDNIDSAIALRRNTAGWNKIVTLDGELILPSGAMTGGSRASKGPNLIVRKQEMDALTEDVGELQATFDAREGQLTSLRDEMQKAVLEIESLDRDAGQKRVSLAECQRTVEYLAQENRRLSREAEVVTAEKEVAAAQLVEEEATLSSLLQELQSFGQDNVDLDETVAQSQSAVESLQVQRRAVRDELLKLNMELAGARERRTNLAQASKDAATSLEEIGSTIVVKREQREKAEVDSAFNSRERRNALTRLEEQTTVYEAAEAALNELVAKKNSLTEQVGSVDHELRSVTHERTELAQLLHDADVKEARLEVQLTQIKARLLEEYEITEEQAVNWQEDIEIKHGEATEVARLRREIRDMGPVNVGAVQEYERLSERWDFLSTQKADLEAAREQLTQAIQEIDESTRDVFMQTFNLVSEAFDLTFHRLFGGGKTKLVLTDPDNLLDTGIEIIVQPPGKNLQNLTLLSGGEKTLTAAALLFALMKVKPSPFCVMDEMDAALDESNVERFADLVKDFSQRTQFIVITHNRSTMEAADTLYGVTMEEPGVSKLISVKMSQKEPGEDLDAPRPEAVEPVPAG